MPAANTLGCHEYLVPSLQDRLTARDGGNVGLAIAPGIASISAVPGGHNAWSNCQRTSEFESRLGRIPMQFLKDGWRVAITNGYSSEQLEDSRRKVALAARRIEEALSQSEWLVGSTYSLADIDAFAICNSLPVLTPELVSVQVTPCLIAWLERIRARPAVCAALSMSRTGQPERAFAPGPEHSRWG
jgi:hypothetical protein